MSLIFPFISGLCHNLLIWWVCWKLGLHFNWQEKPRARPHKGGCYGPPVRATQGQTVSSGACFIKITTFTSDRGMSHQQPPQSYSSVVFDKVRASVELVRHTPRARPTKVDAMGRCIFSSVFHQNNNHPLPTGVCLTSTPLKASHVFFLQS